MATFDMYGFKEENLDFVRSLIEDALGIVFDAHHSLYLGGDYYRQGAVDSENFVLQRNIDLIDNEPIEPNYSAYPTLLYVNRTDRSGTRTLITQSSKKAILLKHEDI